MHDLIKLIIENKGRAKDISTCELLCLWDWLNENNHTLFRITSSSEHKMIWFYDSIVYGTKIWRMISCIKCEHEK